MNNNGKDTKHTRRIARRVNFVRNSENCKMHNIEWYEVDLQLVEIVIKNIEYNYLNSRMKCIVVSLDDRDDNFTRGVKGYMRVFGTRCSI